MREEFDFDAALDALQDGQGLTGKDGILTPLIKQLTEAALQAEMDAHLQNAKLSNRRNGSGRKTIKSTTGSFDLATPRDREGSFEPQLVKKHQTHMSDEIERKIISMFGLGMSYLDIAVHIAEIYHCPAGDCIAICREGAGCFQCRDQCHHRQAYPRDQGMAKPPVGQPLSVCSLPGR